MHQPARLPEIFDQILQNIPVLEFGSRAPPPQIVIVPRVKVWPYPEHPPPPKWKTQTFFPKFRSELTQNTPPKMKNSNFLSWVQIWAYPEHPPNEKL